MKATTAKLLIFALTVLVAVALLNLAQNLQSLSFGEVQYGLPRVGLTPGSPSSGVTPLLLAWLFAVVSLGVFVVGYLWIRAWKGRFPYGELLPLILGALLFVSILYIVQSGVEPATDEEEPGGTDPGEGPPSGEDPNVNNPLTQLFQGDFRFGPGSLALILAFLAFGAIVLLLRNSRLFGGRRGSEGLVRRQALREEMTEVLAARIYRLELGEDIRSVILGAYRDMVNLFRSYGLRIQGSQTAREIETWASRALGLSGQASVELRRRFEEARYSLHPLTEDQRTAAIESLRRVKRELGA